MPEIGEVARIVNYIQKHLVGKTLAKAKAQHDENVFGKVGCSAEAFEKAMTGKKVLEAGQQGKYFWMIMSSPPHPLMHFGMTGWFKIRNEDTAYYKPTKPEESDEWPPKYWKFTLETADDPVCEAAFVDARRLARIRLLDCAKEDIRKVSPLIENGPDPVIDKDIFTEDWLANKLGRKKVPIKALLLDQANISGIGNWVGDEVLYNARIHPEQYSNTLSAAQVKQLHKSIQYVCGFAVDSLADSSKFPEEWLFKHRWGKGKKDSAAKLPNGAKFVYLTVGGRTSCVVPSVQKKTGPVAKDVDDAVDEDAEVDVEEAKPIKTENTPKTSNRKTTAKQQPKPKETGATHGEDVAENPTTPPGKKRRSSTKAEIDTKRVEVKKQKTKAESHVDGIENEAKAETNGRRRSTRASGKGLW